MTSPTNAPRIAWRLATVMEIRQETTTTRTLVLDVPGWPGHLAGQHVDVRLTSEDGYQAERSYSIASPPENPRIELTIERLSEGEVSTYLCGELRAGDYFELRGPIGGYFVWNLSVGGPLLLVAGGSGIVPLMAMLRHRVYHLAETNLGSARVLHSSRSWNEVIYREELARLSASDATLEVRHTITREPPPNWTGFRRRIDRAMLSEVAWAPPGSPRIFVCGPTPLVESVANELVGLGHDPAMVKTERFGPTGPS